MSKADTKQPELATGTWQLCQQKLPPGLRTSLVAVATDPSPLNKKGHANFVTQLRLLPSDRKPSHFWSARVCFFQILIGPVDGALNLGGVQFLQFSDQADCGGGIWRQPVLAILRDLQAMRPSDFVLTERNDEGAIKPQLCTRYRARPDCREFPVVQAADDLAWMVQHSLARFQALPT